MALNGPPLQVVLNITTTNNPFTAWNKLVSIYKPLAVEAYLQLLEEFENCNLEDAEGNPEAWFYKLNLINCRMGRSILFTKRQTFR